MAGVGGDPVGGLSGREDRSAAAGPAGGGERDPVPDAVGGAVEPPAAGVRVGHDGARLVPEVRAGRRVRAALGGVDRRVRRVEGCEVDVAGRRRGDEQGAVLGGLHRQKPDGSGETGHETHAPGRGGRRPARRDHRPGERARQHAHRGRDRGGRGRPAGPEKGPPEPLPRQRVRHPERPGRGREGEVHPPHPRHRRGEETVRCRQGPQAPAVGRRTDHRLAEQVPGHPRPVRQEGRELSRPHPTGVCITLVAASM